MLYKEWRAVRLKLLLVLGAYCLLAAYLYLSIPQSNEFFARPTHFYFDNNAVPFTIPFYDEWLKYAGFISLGAALLAGMDIIAEERDKETLSFLLAKPLTRTRIFATKILLNTAAWVVIFLIISIVMFLIDQQPRVFTMEEFTRRENLPPLITTSQIMASTVTFGEALVKTGLWLLLGTAVTCLSGFISIFSRSILYSLSISLAVLLTIFIAFALLSRNVFGLYATGSYYKLSGALIPALAVLVIGLFGAGLFFFKRKEF